LIDPALPLVELHCHRAGNICLETIVEVPAEALTFMVNQHISTTFNVTQAFVPFPD
jgi:hypothetical protein